MSETPNRQRLAVTAGRLAEACLTLVSSIATLSLAAYAVALITGWAW